MSWRRLAGLSAVLSLVVAGCGENRSAVRALHFPKTSHDFGAVETGPAAKTVSVRFPVENRGERVIHVKKISPSCHCATISGPKIISPRSRGEFEVALSVEPHDFIRRQGLIAIECAEEPNTIYVLEVTAHSKFDMVVEPSRLDLGMVKERAAKSGAIRFFVEGHLNVSFNASSDSQQMSLGESTKVRTVRSDRSFVTEFKFPLEVLAGPANSRGNAVASFDIIGDIKRKIEVPINWETPPALTFSSSQITFFRDDREKNIKLSIDGRAADGIRLFCKNGRFTVAHKKIDGSEIEVVLRRSESGREPVFDTLVAEGNTKETATVEVTALP